jgi:spermidine synthase
MIPWQLIDRARVPGGEGELSLQRRGDEFSIRVGRAELMNSRQHGSEEQLARLGCEPIRERSKARVLVGGLGMGFTLTATLSQVRPDAEVVVAELVGAVVAWNRDHLGHLAGHPLRDARVSVREGDVRAVMAEQKAAFDAILLDVDNGPSGLTQDKNGWLYGPAGLRAARTALREGGVLAVWSVARDDAFTRRLEREGFAVRVQGASARAGNKGARHTIWIAAV